jgi:hypothetical protein
MTQVATGFVVAALFAFGTVRCMADGDSDGGAASSTGARTTTTSRAALEAYCAAALGFATLEPPDIDTAAAEAEQATQHRQYATGTLKPAVDDLVDEAPTEITSDANVVAAAVEELAATGVPETYDNDTVDLARARLHDFELEHCDLASELITMADFSFSGIEGVRPGPVSFDASNEGEEYHELAIVMKRADVTQSFDEILAMDDPAEQQRFATYVGGVQPVAPGEEDFTIVDLRAGDYLVACFLAVGSTPEPFESGAAIDGDPHVARGMKREFRVS